MSLCPKDPPWRNTRILAIARHSPCMLCNVDNGTIVAAHSNALRHGHGMGHKAHDCFIAYLCFDCHNKVDGRTQGLTIEQKRGLWQVAHEKTLLYLFRNGFLTVENPK